MLLFKKYNDIKYQLKKKYNKSFFNYNPYLYLVKSKLISNNLFKSLLNNLIFHLPKNKFIINKIYNVTRKKNQRMGKSKGKIAFQSTYYKGNNPIFIKNKIKYDNFKLLYIKHIFFKLSKKYNFINFK